MKKRMSIKDQIYRVVYAVIGSSVLIAVGFISIRFFVSSYSSMADLTVQNEQQLSEAEIQYHQYLSNLRGFLLAPDKVEYKKAYLEHKEAGHKLLEEIMANYPNPEVKKRIEEIFSFDQEIQIKENDILKAYEENNREVGEKIYRAELLPTFNKMFEPLESADEILHSQMKDAVAKKELVVILGDLAMALILILSSTLISIYSIRLAMRVSKILESISTDLSSTAGTVSETTRGLATASQTLSEAATQQAAAIEETVSSMEEMSSMLSQTSQNSTTTMSLADDGQREGERGKSVIAKMLTAMDEIHSSNERLESIVNLIEDIKSKTKIINDIVFETRLLSFNASIEAARAGVHGKGFAVVAEEVGKLASMSGKAAEEIRSLLESSTAEVSSVVRGTQDRVSAGREISQECQTVFDSMSLSLEKIGESVRMIAAATKEQESGVQQTNKAMVEMDQVTQKNSSSAELLAGQASQLSQGSEKLMTTIDDLKSIIFGGSDQNYSATAKVQKSEINGPAASKKESRLEDVLPMTPVKTSVNSGSGAGKPAVTAKLQDLDRADSRWKAS